MALGLGLFSFHLILPWKALREESDMKFGINQGGAVLVSVSHFKSWHESVTCARACVCVVCLYFVYVYIHKPIYGDACI